MFSIRRGLVSWNSRLAAPAGELQQIELLALDGASAPGVGAADVAPAREVLAVLVDAAHAEADSIGELVLERDDVLVGVRIVESGSMRRLRVVGDQLRARRVPGGVVEAGEDVVRRDRRRGVVELAGDDAAIVAA